MATAFLAAVNGQSDGAAEPNDKIHTVYITKVTFVSGPSPTGPTSPSPFAIETAIVRETIWSNPTSSTWTTLGVGTEYPPTLSTSTVYTTTQLVAVSVKWTTVNVNRRSPGVANGSVALNATDLSPSSSSPPPEESWPSPIISAPESSTMTMVCDLPTPPSSLNCHDGIAVYTTTHWIWSQDSVRLQYYGFSFYGTSG